MAAIRAVEAEETGGKIAAAEEIAHGGEDIGTERPHGGTVDFLVTGDEGLPGGSDDLPERRGTGTGGDQEIVQPHPRLLIYIFDAAQ